MDWDVSSLQVLDWCLFTLTCSCIESPVVISIIHCKDSLTVPIEWLKHHWQTLSDCEISIKSLDVVFSFIEAISIEDLNDLMDYNGSSFIDVKIDLERMEVAGCNDNLTHPVVELVIVELFVYSHCCEESSVRKR